MSEDWRTKAVLISIRPKWCNLIALGKKTIEVRKTAPKLKTPFKCYIYETKGKVTIARCGENGYRYQEGRSGVIGEFVCDKIYEIKNVGYAFKVGETGAETNAVARASCLDFTDMHDYLGRKGGYGWHISDLVIYDTPKKLSDLRLYNTSAVIEHGLPMPTHEIKSPPQSWCYVREE